MRKTLIAVLTVPTTLILCLLLLSAQAPIIQGRPVMLSFIHNVSGMSFEENTELIAVHVLDNLDNQYTFEATGESMSTLEENSILKQFRADIIVSKTYATTAGQAASRTRIKLVLTNPSEVVYYNGYLPTSIVYDNTTYYTVVWSHTLPVENMTQMSAGNWLLRTEYDVYSLPENA